MKLARWLRLFGQDVSNPPPGVDDSVLIEIALEEKRTLLTRDRALSQRCKKAGADCVLIRSSDLDEQLKEAKELGIPMRIDPVRCTLCNGKLIEASEDERRKVPHIGENTPLWRCERCGKLYWEGSHWKNMEDRLKRIEESDS